jgi:SAM-dependent methyltransferase
MCGRGHGVHRRTLVSLGTRLNRVSIELRDGAERFRGSVSKRGLLRTLRLLPRLAWRNATGYVSDVRFDRAYGVRTRGVVKHPRREPRFAGALPYQAAPPVLFRRVIESLEIRYSDFTFIDVGCGKGRALILAAEFPFRRIVGVELSETLADTARENIATFTSRLGHAPPVEVVTCDAVSYTFPSDPCVVFFYNPFLEETMSGVLQNLQSSLREDPRELFVVYVKPMERSALDSAPFLAAIEATRRHVVWRSVLPEESS